MAVERDVVVGLNYYAPYVSGLTATAKVVAEGLAERGWRVTVATTQHDKSLPRQDVIGGVDVVRAPVLARVGKGVISPQLPGLITKLARGSSAVHLHLPMLEAGLIARLAGRTPLVTTYHCDVMLPSGLFNALQIRAMDVSSSGALKRSHAVVCSSEDYAARSRIHGSIRTSTQAIAPPCQLRENGRPTFRDGTGQHIGFLGRIVEEKGLEYLVEAFLAIARPQDRLLIAGDYAAVAGGSVIGRVKARAGTDARIRFLGFIAEEQLADFYASLDVFALPSVNSLEAFGIVQVEAMMCGVPVVASDLPGVRTPVLAADFGVIVPPRDVEALGTAIVRLRDSPVDRQAGASRARSHFGASRTIDSYEELFRELITGPA